MFRTSTQSQTMFHSITCSVMLATAETHSPFMDTCQLCNASMGEGDSADFRNVKSRFFSPLILFRMLYWVLGNKYNFFSLQTWGEKIETNCEVHTTCKVWLLERGMFYQGKAGILQIWLYFIFNTVWLETQRFFEAVHSLSLIL